MTAEPLQPLQSLLSRVREAKGPDRRLNWEVWWYCAANGGKGNTHPPPKDYEREHWLSAPLYTGNVAEAIALVERVLPKAANWKLLNAPAIDQKAYEASIFLKGFWSTNDDDALVEDHDTPALALVAATIAALIAIAKEQTS